MLYERRRGMGAEELEKEGEKQAEGREGTGGGERAGETGVEG